MYDIIERKQPPFMYVVFTNCGTFLSYPFSVILSIADVYLISITDDKAPPLGWHTI